MVSETTEPRKLLSRWTTATTLLPVVTELRLREGGPTIQCASWMGRYKRSTSSVL